jgi:lipid-A-disaccharide synthase
MTRGVAAVGPAQDDAREGEAGREKHGRGPDLIALFPGSRVREVTKILPVMLQAGRELLRSHPELRFEIAAASESLGRAIEAAVGGDTRFAVRIGQGRELMMRSNAAMIASGTATLEAVLAGLPFVLVYRVAWLTYFAARLVVKVRWLGMPNVLANREIVPEFIQHKARPIAIARAVAQLVDDAAARAAMLDAFACIRSELISGAAETNAADAVLAELRDCGRTSSGPAGAERARS